MRIRRYLCAGSLAALMVTGCDRGAHPRMLNNPAPEFSITDNGHTLDLAKMRGSVVLLNFWGPWCEPCLLELPTMTALQQQMPQLKVVAIGVPGPEGMRNADEASYRRYLGQHPTPFLAAFDGAQRINQLYGTVQFPETYLIDKHGVVRRKFVNQQVWTDPEIVRFVKQLVDERG